MPRLLEIACFQPSDLRLANEAGADRLEYCRDYAVGGLTPDLVSFESLRRPLSVPVLVMIRPQAGSFVYDRFTVRKMATTVRDFAAAGADGWVWGVLDDKGRIDEWALETLASAANGGTWTFHRAFDQLHEPLAAIEKLLEYGCSNILTSGSNSTALAGKANLAAYAAQAAGRLRILAGGGIRSSNLEELLVDASDFDVHSAALDAHQKIDAAEIDRLKEILLSLKNE
jgi:copper homeostasis protein